MTFTNISQNQNQAVEIFQRFEVDDQLALLWYIYQEIGSSITPKGGPDTSGFDIAQGMVDQIQQMAPDQQLQIQRDILAGSPNTQAGQTYANSNSSTRLAFWYLLAQCMERGNAVQVPANYKLNQEAQGFLQAFQQIDFNDQITFMRNVVALTGSQPKPGAVV